MYKKLLAKYEILSNKLCRLRHKIITLYMKKYNLTFPQADEMFCEVFDENFYKEDEDNENNN